MACFHAQAHRALSVLLCALCWFMLTLSDAYADSPVVTDWPTTGAYTAKLKGVRSNVAVVEIDGDYSRDAPGGKLNIEPRGLVAKELYKQLADRYDFIVAFSNFEFNTGFALAFYSGIRNDTKGIGQPLFDNSAYFGSRGVLQGYIDMAALSRYVLDPSDPGFEEVMRVLSHELLHRWAANVRYLDASGEISSSLLGKDGSHWSFLLDTGGSVEYGNRWFDNGDGTFTSKPDRQFFSPLDLYLMGMLKKEQVPPFFLIKSPGVSPLRLPEVGVTITGARETITVDQIIAAEGPREPAADQAQKQFRIAYVLLTRPGVEATEEQIAAVNQVRLAFDTRLTALTGGQALAHTFLEPKSINEGLDTPTYGGVIPGSVGSKANLSKGRDWLRAKQQLAGDWYDHPLTRLRDTVVAASAIADAGSVDLAPVDRASVWLNSQTVNNTDYVARRLQALGGKATPADWEKLVGMQNPDGGWGAAAGYQSTPLDTALAVIALALDPDSSRQALARDRARAFLLAQQNPDGGWSHAVSGVSRTATTAQVVRALANLDSAAPIAAASTFLAGRQNPDGGFGDSPSTIHDTANVIQSLASAGQLGAVRALQGFDFLNATQSTDGSWEGSVYATGLAIRTLGTAQTYNWTVSNFTVTPNLSRDGKRVALSLLVKNPSTVASPITVVKVFSGDPSVGPEITEIPVPPLEPGQGVVVRGSWVTTDKVGEHVLTAVVDPLALAAELTRVDNTANTRVTVLPAATAADLEVTAADVTVLPSVINRLPFTASVLAQVSNLGKTDALGVKVRLLSGPSADSLVVVDEKIVNLIARSTIPVSTTFNVTRPGRQILSVVVDPDNLVDDADRTNNRGDTAIETLSTVDVGVYSVDLSVPSTPVALGSDVSFKATLNNFGTSDTAPFQALVTVTDGTAVREVGRLTVQLAGGSSKTFTLPWRADLTGDLTLRVALDPGATLADIDRTNNEASARFVVGPAPTGPNLAVSFRDFLIEPDPANEGRPLTLKATIRNTGTMAANSVEYGFYEGDRETGGRLLAPLQTLPTIAAGAAIEVSLVLSDVLGDAERLYFIAVDPAKKITEVNKDDNSAFRVLAVNALADLVVASGDISFSPVAPKPGDEINVTVEVQNLGKQAATPVLVRLLDGSTVIGEKTIASIAAQSKSSVSFGFTLPSLSTVTTLTLVIDPDDAVLETNKANNTASRRLTVQSGSAFVTEPYFSPNGDNVKDAVSFGFRIDSPLVTKVLVLNESGQTVRIFTGLGVGPQAEGSVIWDGRDDLGRIVSDGKYLFRAVGTDSISALAETDVVLDTNRAHLLRALGTPAEFRRNLTCKFRGVNPNYHRVDTLDERSLFVTEYLRYDMVARNSQMRISRIDLDGGFSTPVITPSAVTESPPDVLSASARGDVIAFLKYSDFALEIWTANGDGTGQRKLDTISRTPGYSDYVDLTVTHDGRSIIAFISSSSDSRFKIRRYPVDPYSGAMFTLFDGHGIKLSYRRSSVPVNQDISPDRRHVLVAYEEDGKDLNGIINLESGEFTRIPAEVLTGGGYQTSFTWSPDSSRILRVSYGEKAQVHYDVYDTLARLIKRFPTQAVDTGLYAYNESVGFSPGVSAVDWLGSSDEFVVYSHNRFFKEWRVLPLVVGDVTSYEHVYENRANFYRADIKKGTLTEIPLPPRMASFSGTWHDFYRGLYISNLKSFGGDRNVLLEFQQLESGEATSNRYFSFNIDTGEDTEIESKSLGGANGGAQWSTYAYSPNTSIASSGRRIVYSTYVDASDPTNPCYVAPTAEDSSSGVYAVGNHVISLESLHNLVVDLQPLRDPRLGGLVLRGTAADLNFAGYQLAYADVRSPDDWRPVAPSGTEQKVSAILANWVPPGYGNYLVRLTATDLAGNTANAIRRVSWTDTPAITDLIKDHDYISPNGDGLQDKLRLSYKVLEPVHLVFDVLDETGARVRTVERDHASIGAGFVFEWDGRDDRSAFVNDGKYAIRVLNFEFQVEVDTVHPTVELTASAHAFDNVPLGNESPSIRFDSLSASASGLELKFVVLDGRQATVSVLSGTTTLFKSSPQGPGHAQVVWDGLDREGRPVPSGRYTWLIQTEDERVTIDADVSRAVDGLKVTPRNLPIFMLTGESEVPFAALMSDKNLLSQGLDIGWGDPPPTWSDTGKRAKISTNEKGISVGMLNGRYVTTRDFNGSRLRLTAADKAGNLVTVTSPYVSVRELVLLKAKGDFWINGVVTPSVPQNGAKGNAQPLTTFTSEIIPLTFTGLGITSSHQLTELTDLRFGHNLPTAAREVHLRYVLIEPSSAPGGIATIPTQDALPSLAWKTAVLVGGASPPDESMGLTGVENLQNHIKFDWQLPRPSRTDSLLLYQVVAFDEDGRELPSNIYWVKVVPADDPVLALRAEVTWNAYHEPALSCNSPPSENAHVQVTVPAFNPILFPVRVSGFRLNRVMTTGSKELVAESIFVSNERADLFIDQTINTATWPVGRHDFELEVLVEGSRWTPAASPYIYVNHTAPIVKINSPVDGQKICAARMPVPGSGTLGYVPMEVSVKDTYATYQDVQIQNSGDSWEHRGPVAEPVNLYGAESTKLKLPGPLPSICDFPGGCGNSGVITWPDRPGDFGRATSTRLYGASANWSPDEVGKELNGTVTARLRAYGPSGHLSCTPVTVDVDGAVEGESSIDKTLFSPNGDSVLDDVTVTVSVIESVTVKLEVLRAVMTKDGLRALEGEPVSVLADSMSVGSGSRSFVWDGRNTGGAVVPDGLYALRITMKDGCGNEKVRLFGVEVDKTPPAIVVVSPKAHADVPTEFFVNGSVTDLHPLRYELFGILEASPDEPIMLPNLGSMNSLNVNLGSWNTLGAAGTAKVRIVAFDTAGNSSTLEVPVRLAGPAELISALIGSPDPFSPNADGRRDKISLFYTLNKAANITLKLQRGITEIRTLVDNQPSPAGNGTLDWDGKNNLGLVEADGEITAVLVAEVIEDGAPVARQTVPINFILDKTPPAIVFSSPKGPVTTGAAGAIAKATDPALAEATLAVSVAGAPWVGIARANDDTGNLSATLETLPEGPIRLRTQAVDRAENQSSSTLDLVLDRTPPKVNLTEPKAKAFISGRKGPFSIEGSVDELNLARYRLLLDTSVLFEASALPTSSKLFTWNPLPIADGPYQLRLEAEDQAGLVGGLDLAITVDNTPPVAAITSAGTPMYVRLGSTINGTASDLNVLNYRLELAPGGTTSTRWTEIARGSSSVTAGALATLATLPTDGIYGLRLTVEDKAGNDAVALHEVVVDTVAPQAVLLTAEIKNRRDADVTWTAPPDTDVVGYNLYRNGSKINAELITALAYLDVGLPSGNYSYIVKAVDRAGNEGIASNQANVVVTSSEPVAQIFAPLRDAYAAGLMDIRGTAKSPTDFKEYRVYVGAGAEPTSWALLRRSPLALTADVLASWNTLSLIDGSLYTLKLEAEDLSGVIATDRVTVKVKNTPPTAPINLVGTLSVNNIALTWTANTEPDLQGYLLYRNGKLANATGLVIGSLVPYLIKPAAYNDLAVPDGKHRYFVQAMDMAGNTSGPSNEVEFTVDTRPPHVAVTQPADNSKVSQSVTLIGVSQDSDLKQVQFQYKAAASGTWLNINVPLTQKAGPWSTIWDLASLPYGSYHVRAVGTDEGGKTDPTPGFITLLLTDLRKPEALTTLSARVKGGEVALNWAASPSSTAVGYHIDRVEPNGSVNRLTTTPVTGINFTDLNVPDGSYIYRVRTISESGNESDASNDAAAVVFTPLFDHPYTPTADATTSVLGQTRVGHSVTLLNVGTSEKGIVGTAGSGNFRFDSIALSMGGNVFEIAAIDDKGNSSRTVTWRVVRGVVPAKPTGLSAALTGDDVTLSWASNTEPDLAGYVSTKSGVPLTEALKPPTAWASSFLAFYLLPENAIDDDNSTGWSPDGTAGLTGQWLAACLSEHRLIGKVSLVWEPGAIPKHYRIDGRTIDGDWVPLTSVKNVTGDRAVEVKLPRPYKTDCLRVFIVEATHLQLNEITLNALTVAPELSATFTDAAALRPAVGVMAVSNLGLVSEAAQVKPVATGEATTLSGYSVDASAQLMWSLPIGESWAAVEIYRDGVLLRTLGLTYSTIDPDLANGDYVYNVKPIDAEGIPGPVSNDLLLNVSVAGVSAPITVTANSPLSGSSVDLSWTLGSGALPSSYTVRRATTASGPYSEIASGLTTKSYVDQTIVAGTRYFYVINGLDRSGASISTSNEVSVLPEDRVAPDTPYFVKPGRSPGPVLTSASQVTLEGFTEPGARVLISKGGSQIGSVMATREAAERAFAGTAGLFDLASTGDLLYYPYGGKLVTRLSDGVAVPATALNAGGTSVENFRFSPDGRSAAFIRRELGQDALFRWDMESDKATRVSDLGQSGFLAFSPNGAYLVASAYDATLMKQGLIVVSWTGRDVRFLEGSFTGAAWSPDGKTLAATTYAELRLVDPMLSSDVSVPGVFAPSAPSWLPDGSGLLFHALGSLDGLAIKRVNMPSLSVDILAEIPGVNYSKPVASPDGEAYLALRDRQLVQRGFDGSEVILSDQGYGAPVWSSSKAIAYLRDSESLVLLTPAGHFSLASTPLSVGSNFFEAYSIDARSNTSPPAVTLEVRRLSDALPDWSIDTNSWWVFPATPQVGEATDIALTVKNLGAPAPGTTVSVTVTDEKGSVTRVFTGTLNALAKDSQQTISMRWAPTKAGRYTLNATVDGSREIEEAREDNNLASREFFVTTEGTRPELQVRSSKPTYAASETVMAEVIAINPGVPFDGNLVTRIVDLGGSELFRFESRAVNALRFGFPQTYTFSWPSGTTLAGEYRVTSELIATNGQSITSASAAFAIAPSVKLSVSLLPDRASYIVGDDVKLNGNVRFVSGNVSTIDVPAVLSVLSAAGDTVLTKTVALKDLLTPGGEVNLDLMWPAASPAGAYIADLKVGTDVGGWLAQAQTPFTIAAPAVPLVSGRLVVLGDVFSTTEAISSTLAVTNVGAPLSPLSVRVRAVDTTNNQTLATWSGALTGVGATATTAAVALTSTWPLAGFEIRLEALVGSDWVLLDRSRVKATEKTPPGVAFTSPAPGAVVRSTATISALVTARQTTIAKVELSHSPDNWSLMLPVIGSPGVYQANTLPPADGPVTLQLRASDTLSNVSAPVSLALVIDNTPPLISIAGVTAGATITGTAKPVVTVTDLHLQTTEILLDGLPFVSGGTVSTTGSHTLSVKAVDAAGNESQQTVAFKIDTGVALSGALVVSPDTIALGETVTLDTRLSHAASTVLNDVQVKLEIRDRSSGTLLQTFTDIAAVAPGAPGYQRAWSWKATGTAGALLDVVLSATVEGAVLPMASGTLQLSAPNTNISLEAALEGPRKLLVYVRCTRLEDETWDNCAAPNRAFSVPATVSACTSDRAAWLTQYLAARGVSHTLVTDEASFVRELRSGMYSTYWIGGGALKLGSLAASLVQAAVQRGDTLLTEGWTSGRSSMLEQVSGVSFLGKWSSLQASITTVGSVLPSATLVTNTPVRLSTTNGVRHATLNNGHGIVSNSYGRGRSLAFAFDLSGTLRSASESNLLTWNSLITAGLQSIVRTAPLDLVAGGVFNLKARIANAGSTPQLLDYLAKLPAQANVLQSAPEATASTTEGGLPTLRWRATAAAAGDMNLALTARAPLSEGDYIVSNVVDQISSDGRATLLHTQAISLRVIGALGLTESAFASVQAVVVAEAQNSVKTNVLNALMLAKMSITDARWNDALRQLIGAQAAVQRLVGSDADDARLAIARAIEAVEKRL